MDLWKMQLRAASFRGVSFGVTADESEGGRRTVTHEFPQREAPYVEDLGGAPRRFTVQAFVLGSDYMSRRDALEAALQQPGPGTLVHPWYGEVQVSQTAPYKVRHSAQDGGMGPSSSSFSAAIPSPTARRQRQPGTPGPPGSGDGGPAGLRQLRQRPAPGRAG